MENIPLNQMMMMMMILRRVSDSKTYYRKSNYLLLSGSLRKYFCITVVSYSYDIDEIIFNFFVGTVFEIYP